MRNMCQLRLKGVFGMLFWGVMMIVAVAEHSRGLSHLGSNEIHEVMGGTCVACVADPKCTRYPTQCVDQGNGQWKDERGTGIGREVCSSAASRTTSLVGTERCTNIDTQDCLLVKLCTRAGCPDGSCTAQPPVRETTKCRRGGHSCIIPKAT